MNFIERKIIRYKKRKDFLNKIENYIKKNGKIQRSKNLLALPYYIKTDICYLFWGDDIVFVKEFAPIYLGWLRALRIKRFFKSQVDKFRCEDSLSKNEKEILSFLEKQ